MSGKPPMPPNIPLVPLPPECPELNVMENVWQFMRDNWLSNRIFPFHDAIVDLCCDAWRRLIDQPWIIMSIGAARLGIQVMINGTWYNPNTAILGRRFGFDKGNQYYLVRLRER